MTDYTRTDAPASIPPAVNPAKADTITVVRDYHAAYNAVIEPEKYVATSQYFIRRWMPLLGGVGTMIVLTLRSLGYYNPSTGETRDGVEIDQPGLAKLCGIHPATLKREFARNKTLTLFVTRESNYYRDKITGHVLRAKNEYRIKMDDPLHDNDLPRLQAALDARDKPAPRKARIAPNSSNRAVEGKAQYAPNGEQPAKMTEQCAPKTVQSALPKAQNAPTLKDYSYLPEITQKTLDDAAPAAPDNSFSLFQEPEKIEPEEPKPRSREWWEIQDSNYARRYCQDKGWQWRGTLKETESGDV